VFSEEEEAMNSPLTLRRCQKNAVSQLLPTSPRLAAHGTESGKLEPSSAQGGSGGDFSADGGGDVLAKPTFATQLVLGCYVATQKATGVYRDLTLEGNCLVLGSVASTALHRIVCKQHALCSLQEPHHPFWEN
jgi:hypothetical protein